MDAKITRLGDDFVIRLSSQDVQELGLVEGGSVLVLPTPKPTLTLDHMMAEMDRLGPDHRPDLVDWGPDVGAEIIRDDYSR